jgi:medium-chain acyl-[acyl-carrier-protein] hydrolase
MSVIDNAELLDLLLPVMRADFMAVENYRYQEAAPLADSRRVYGGRADPEVPPGTLEAWQRHTTGDFAITRFDSGHFFLDSARAVQLEQIAPDLRPPLAP